VVLRIHRGEDGRGAAEWYRADRDDLYLMAHNDVTGRPFLQPRAVGLGLAGGLLAELMLLDMLRLTHGWVATCDPGQPRDELGYCVLGLIASERELHPVRDWLAFLARTAAADVAVRLEHAGYLRQTRLGRPRHGGRWVPADPDCAFAPLGRARSVLQAAGAAAAYATVLAGLAVGSGLGPRPGPKSAPCPHLSLPAGWPSRACGPHRRLTLLQDTRRSVTGGALARPGPDGQRPNWNQRLTM
jgi:Golgi phosphoprotein 3 (GPP34)